MVVAGVVSRGSRSSSGLLSRRITWIFPREEDEALPRSKPEHPYRAVGSKVSGLAAGTTTR